MARNDFLEGFMQGFYNSGGGMNLSSMFAKNFQGGEYYDMQSDPMAMQAYQQAMQGGPLAQKQFLNEYDKYIGYDTPNNINDTSFVPNAGNLTYNQKAQQVFGTTPKQTVNLGEVMKMTDPEGYQAGRYSSFSNINIPLDQFEGFVGEGFGMIGPQYRKTMLEGNTEIAEQDLLGSQAGYYDEYAVARKAEAGLTNAKTRTEEALLGPRIDSETSLADYRTQQAAAQNALGQRYLEEAATEKALREGRINELNAEIDQIKADTNLTREEKLTEIQAREDAKAKINADIGRINAQAGYQKALTGKANAETNNIQNPQMVDLSNNPYMNKLGFDNLSVPANSLDKYLDDIVKMYTGEQTGGTTGIKTGTGTDLRQAGVDSTGEPYYINTETGSYYSFNEDGTLTPTPFTETHRVVGTTTDGRNVYEASDENGRTVYLDEYMMPVEEGNIISDPSVQINSPGFFENLLNNMRQNNFIGMGSNNQIRENVIEQSGQANMPNESMPEGSPQPLNEIASMYKQNYPDMSGREIAETIQNQSEEWKNQFVQKYGISIEDFIASLTSME